MITIVDVAKAANVSIATVSRVLNNSDHPVNVETRKRVLETASALNYSPSALARALITSETYILGIIVRDVLDPYFAAIVRGAENVARALGFLLIVCSSDRDPDTEFKYATTLNDYRVDGIIFAGGGLTDPSYLEEMESLLQSLRARNCAVLSIGRQKFPCAHICNDETAAAKDATQHLISLGHRRICYISGTNNITTAELRLEGYKQALAANSIQYNAKLIVEGDYTTKAGLQAGEQILRIEPRPTAILASNDLMAIGCMRNLKEAGLRIPQSISVIGMDDIADAEWVDPALTTVCLNMAELGARAVECAMKLRNGEIDQKSSYTVEHELIVRDSTESLLKPSRESERKI